MNFKIYDFMYIKFESFIKELEDFVVRIYI